MGRGGYLGGSSIIFLSETVDPDVLQDIEFREREPSKATDNAKMLAEQSEKRRLEIQELERLEAEKARQAEAVRQENFRRLSLEEEAIAFKARRNEIKDNAPRRSLKEVQNSLFKGEVGRTVPLVERRSRKLPPQK